MSKVQQSSKKNFQFQTTPSFYQYITIQEEIKNNLSNYQRIISITTIGLFFILIEQDKFHRD